MSKNAKLNLSKQDKLDLKIAQENLSIPGYMVQIHISPYSESEIDKLVTQFQKDASLVMSSLVYSHFESSSEAMRGIMVHPDQSHLFVTYFVEAALALAVIGGYQRVDGYLLHKREANALVTAVESHQTDIDLAWIQITFQSFNSDRRYSEQPSLTIEAANINL